MKVRDRLFFSQTVTEREKKGGDIYNLLKILSLSLSLCDTFNCHETVTCHRLSRTPPPLLWRQTGTAEPDGAQGRNAIRAERGTPSVHRHLKADAGRRGA